MSNSDPIDRLREMFGIEATEPAAVWDALEKYDAHNLRTIESLRDHLQMQTQFAALEHEAQQRWQGMAEDLWEELQEWHHEDNRMIRTSRCPRTVGADCTCHRILAAKWDELTHADEYADEVET